MVVSHNRKQEIIAAFQRRLREDNASEIESIGIKELQDVNAMLGQRDLNEGYRIAIQDRIAELDKIERRRHESKIRVWNVLTGILIGVVVSALSLLLFGCQ